MPDQATVAVVTVAEFPTILALVGATLFVLDGRVHDGVAEVEARSSVTGASTGTVLVKRRWGTSDEGEHLIVSDWLLRFGEERPLTFKTRREYRAPPDGLSFSLERLRRDFTAG